MKICAGISGGLGMIGRHAVERIRVDVAAQSCGVICQSRKAQIGITTSAGGTSILASFSQYQTVTWLVREPGM
ncbi:MAG: hypothetical protein IPL29_02850 [Propionivibrio sp.]|nr:hypothetical protein [Propionivibrio sp.]